MNVFIRKGFQVHKGTIKTLFFDFMKKLVDCISIP